MFRTVLTSLLAVLVLCGSAFAAEKTLIAAANPTWPPMEFLDENKNIIGYDRDIIAAIAEEIGMKSEFRNIAWDGIFASLESGQANVIASCVTITDKRKKAYVFSDPYYEVHQAVVVAKDSAIKKPEDLKGKKVGVQIGTTAIEALRKMNVDIDLRTYDEVGLVFEDMRNGRLDVVVCDGFTGNVVLKSLESSIRMFKEILKEEVYRSWLSKFGMLLAKGAFVRMKKRLPIDKFSGAPLLGLNGLVVKAHGSSNRRQIAGAIEITLRCLRKKMNDRIAEDVASLAAAREQNKLAARQKEEGVS